MALAGIIGIKLGMGMVYDENRNQVPVTLVDTRGCVVTQIKTDQTDGYSAVQVGRGKAKEKRITKPMQGHLKPSGASSSKLVEFRVEDAGNLEVGQAVENSIFSVGDKLKVTGVSKGRGFSGGMRRHGFSGAQKTHGQSDRHRAPGSIGSGTYPGRVIPGLKMAGHYGAERCTTRGLRLVSIDEENGILHIKGAVPGPKNGTLIIQKQEQGK